jgi:hypothetical protein
MARIAKFKNKKKKQIYSRLSNGLRRFWMYHKYQPHQENYRLLFYMQSFKFQTKFIMP